MVFVCVSERGQDPHPPVAINQSRDQLVSQLMGCTKVQVHGRSGKFSLILKGFNIGHIHTKNLPTSVHEIIVLYLNINQNQKILLNIDKVCILIQ